MGPIETTIIYEKLWGDYYLESKDALRAMIPADSFYTGVYSKITYGSSYVIPKLYLGNDSVTNLRFIITEYDHSKTGVFLYSFEYREAKPDSSIYYTGYDIWAKFKKPIKRKLREILK